MKEFWQDKIKAFLHDPPDKALILFHKSHEKKVADIWDNIGLKDDAKRLRTFIEKRKGLREAYPQIHNADVIASAMQRLDIPPGYRMDNAANCDVHICFKGTFKPVFKHTLSGAMENFDEIKRFIATYGYERALEKYGFNLNAVRSFLDESDWKKMYFLLWRFLPEIYDLGYILPADTRIPDHSIWDHLDVTSAIFSCLRHDVRHDGLCLFAVKIPAVQEFISHSRKLSDLWASSHIYSTIIFEGIKVIVDKFGPDVIIYPQLRGNPMFDLAEFTGEHSKFRLSDESANLGLIDKKVVNEKLQVANFPNVFLCFIPISKNDIHKEVEDAIRQRWREIADKARDLLSNEADIYIDKKLWNDQINTAVEVAIAWLRFYNFNEFNKIKDKIPSDLRELQEKWLSFVEEAERRSNYGYFYLVTYELLGIILAQKSRLWKAWKEQPITGKKCLMCGRRNALLERFRDEKSKKEFYRYWKDNKWNKKPIDELKRFKHLLKEGERLCAVCLTKRLYGWRPRSIFEEIFKDFKPPKQESVVYVAARDFIENFETHPILRKVIERDIELIYKHEWGESEERIPEEKRKSIEELKRQLKKNWKELKDELKKAYEQLGKKPNKYYAILMMDGDRIGKMLSGETLPNFGEFLHPVFKNKIKEWREKRKEKGKELVEMRRILTPSHHIAISRAMKDFSLYVVPKIAKEYKGFLVYAGGDDVLALFPTDKVLNAAKEIQEWFRKDFYEIDVNGRKKKVMGLGNKASMSAGIVFAHYKWPLHDAIEKVREAERKAKNDYGRNAFCMTFIKRSGEILTAGGKWDFVNDLIDIAKAIIDRKISHRFIYDFIDVSDVLKGDMLKAEVRRLLERRREKAKDEELREINGKLCCLIEKYEAQGLSAKELGNAIKILYDAYRGEER